MSVEITYDGQPVVTTNQAAETRQITPAAMRRAISINAIEPVGYLDGRTPLYDPADLDRVLNARPGRGAHLRRSARTTDTDQG